MVHSASLHTQPGAALPVLDMNHPPFTKKRCGRLYCWASELDLAYGFAQREGLTFQLATADYQVAKLIGSDVRILIYPHKTKSTGNVSLRVRDENSANRPRAEALMAAMDALVPDYNTFSRNNGIRRWERERAERAAVAADKRGGDAEGVNPK